MCVCMFVLFVSLGKSRQWDPWLPRPSCHSKSQSHLWHWAPWSYYVWTFVHHLPGWERRETRECGRGKHSGRMHFFLHAWRLNAQAVLCIKTNVPLMILCFVVGLVFLLVRLLQYTKKAFFMLFSKLVCITEHLCPSQLHTARRERSPLPDDKVRYVNLCWWW